MPSIQTGNVPGTLGCLLRKTSTPSAIISNTFKNIIQYLLLQLYFIWSFILCPIPAGLQRWNNFDIRLKSGQTCWKKQISKYKKFKMTLKQRWINIEIGAFKYYNKSDVVTTLKIWHWNNVENMTLKQCWKKSVPKGEEFSKWRYFLSENVLEKQIKWGNFHAWSLSCMVGICATLTNFKIEWWKSPLTQCNTHGVTLICKYI